MTGWTKISAFADAVCWSVRTELFCAVDKEGTKVGTKEGTTGVLAGNRACQHVDLLWDLCSCLMSIVPALPSASLPSGDFGRMDAEIVAHQKPASATGACRLHAHAKSYQPILSQRRR